MSCAAPEASPREQAGTKHVVGGTSYGDDPTSLRDSAIRLAEAGQVRAAIPLFQAVVALDPSKPLGHSDEGVSWMRLKEYEQARLAPTPLSHPCPRLAPTAMPPTAAVAPAVQSWGAFKRALDLEPAHGLSLQNRRDLTGFLSHTAEGQRIMHTELCGEQGGSAFGQCALQHASPAPEQALGGLYPWPASANQPLCGKPLCGSAFGQLALRRLLSAPDRAPGCQELRPASASQLSGPH